MPTISSDVYERVEHGAAMVRFNVLQRVYSVYVDIDNELSSLI